MHRRVRGLSCLTKAKKLLTRSEVQRVDVEVLDLLQQQPDHVRAAVEGGHVQRGHLVRRPRLRVGADGDEVAGDGRRVALGGAV